MAELKEMFADLLSLEYQKVEEIEISKWDRLFSNMVSMGNLEFKEFK